jgi:hypothetical protein
MIASFFVNGLKHRIGASGITRKKRVEIRRINGVLTVMHAGFKG